MQCPACGMANSPGRIYCGGCAAAIGSSCAACFFVNEPGNRYCGGCARDLLAAPGPTVEPVRAAVAGPAAPAATALVTPPVSPGAGEVQGGLMSDLQDLEDLIPPGPAAVCGESCPTTDADATQGDVDSYFRRLAREGVVEIHPDATAGPAPGTSGSAPS